MLENGGGGGLTTALCPLHPEYFTPYIAYSV